MRALIPVTCLFLMLPSAVTAKPWKPFKNLGPLVQPKGEVTIYVAPDPSGQGRDADAATAAGTLNDIAELKEAGISVKIVNGIMPADAQNAMQVSFGSVQGGGPGIAKPTKINTGKEKTTITQSSVVLNSDPEVLPRNLVERFTLHEILHNFGLAHDPTSGDIMNEVLDDDKAYSLTKDGALKELNGIYNAGLSKIDLTPNVDMLSANEFVYTYNVEWKGGPELALFDVSIGNATVHSLTVPTGWAIGPLALPSDLIWDLGDFGFTSGVLTFQLVDPSFHIGETNPFMQFSFVANQSPGVGRVWLNGMRSSIVPVPEPKTWIIMVLGFGIVGARMRIYRGQDGGISRSR